MIPLVPLPAVGAAWVTALHDSVLVQALSAHHGGAAGLVPPSRGAVCLLGPLAGGAAGSVAAPLLRWAHHGSRP